jgi:hypothetical protein
MNRSNPAMSAYKKSYRHPDILRKIDPRTTDLLFFFSFFFFLLAVKLFMETLPRRATAASSEKALSRVGDR